MKIYIPKPYPCVKVFRPSWMSDGLVFLLLFIGLVIMCVCYSLVAIPFGLFCYWICGCPARFGGWKGLIAWVLISHGFVALLWELLKTKSDRIRFCRRIVLAHLGFPQAQYELGAMCVAKTGYDNVRGKGKAWLSRAAASGNVFAMWKLARAYSGNDMPMCDLPKAYECFLNAAEAGHVGAMCAIGYCYAMGKGVEKSPEDAAIWYLRAANYGLVPAMHNIGYCYKMGLGVKADVDEAELWFGRAAELGFYDHGRDMNGGLVGDYAVLELWNLSLLACQPQWNRQFSDEFLDREFRWVR